MVSQTTEFSQTEACPRRTKIILIGGQKSPVGKSIVAGVLVEQMIEAKYQFYLIDADGKNLRVLKNSEKNESEPKFSPVKKVIAFIRDSQIWQCDLDGSNEKQLTNIYNGASGFEWSADGKKMLYFNGNTIGITNAGEKPELGKGIAEGPLRVGSRH